MSSQLIFRNRKRTGRSMEAIKADYDRAAAQAETIQNRYDNEYWDLAKQYNFKRVELRYANKRSRRAELIGEHDQIVLWVRKAEQLQGHVLPGLMSKLEQLHGELLKARNEVKLLLEELAIRAGISDSYWDAIKVVDDARGGFSIYFGGVDSADGPGHAHYVFNQDFEMRYRREPARQQPVPRWRR